MAADLVESTRRSSSIGLSLNDQYQNEDPLMPLNINERSEEREGELSTFVLYINYLLNDNISRHLMYLGLMFIASFPMFIDSIELFEVPKMADFDENSFCDDELSCWFTLVACVCIYVAIFTLYWAMGKNFYNKKIFKISCVTCLCVGNVFLMLTVLWVTLKPNTSPNRTCFKVTNNNGVLCRASYFGNNCVGVMIGWLAIIDIINIKHRKFTQNNDSDNIKFYLSLRMKVFSILLIISSFCIVINLIINGHFYVKAGSLTNIALVVCWIGYSMIIVISLFSLLIFDRLQWFYKEKVGDIMSKLLFVAVLCIQTRSFSDLFVFSIVCLIMSVDIQVLKEQ